MERPLKIKPGSVVKPPKVALYSPKKLKLIVMEVIAKYEVRYHQPIVKHLPRDLAEKYLLGYCLSPETVTTDDCNYYSQTERFILMYIIQLRRKKKLDSKFDSNRYFCIKDEQATKRKITHCLNYSHIARYVPKSFGLSAFGPWNCKVCTNGRFIAALHRTNTDKKDVLLVFNTKKLETYRFFVQAQIGYLLTIALDYEEAEGDSTFTLHALYSQFDIPFTGQERKNQKVLYLHTWELKKCLNGLDLTFAPKIKRDFSLDIDHVRSGSSPIVILKSHCNLKICNNGELLAFVVLQYDSTTTTLPERNYIYNLTTEKMEYDSYKSKNAIFSAGFSSKLRDVIFRFCNVPLKRPLFIENYIMYQPTCMLKFDDSVWSSFKNDHFHFKK